jgi:DNA-binding MarR family transcriptional regulator
LTGGEESSILDLMPEIASVRYTHDGIIDEIIAFPAISQGELASRFGYTQSWMSIIINSDAFQERLAERKGELVDPKIRASVSDRLEALAKRSLDKLLERLDTQQPFSNAELISAAKLGAGDIISRPSVQQNNMYVLQIPPSAPDPAAWLRSSGKSSAVDISHTNPEA